MSTVTAASQPNRACDAIFDNWAGGKLARAELVPTLRFSGPGSHSPGPLCFCVDLFSFAFTQTDAIAFFLRDLRNCYFEQLSQVRG
jgi:hypothetical protein